MPKRKSRLKENFEFIRKRYANAYASKICAGKIKDPSGTKRKDWGPKKAALGLFAASKMGKNKLKKLAMKRASMATPNTYLATQNFNSGKEVKKPKGRMFTAAEVRALDESTGSKVNPKKKERIMQSGDKDKIKLSKTNLKDFNVVAWLEEWVLLLRVVNSEGVF